MATAVITGITGFVGGHLAEHLLAEGYKVVGLGPQQAWEPWTPPKVQEQVELWAWDFRLASVVPEKVEEYLREFAPSAIFHLAAISVPDQCGLQQPTEEAWEVNVLGTAEVLRLAERLPGPPRVLFTSSSHVYAPVLAESPKVDESWPTLPRSAYARTKLAAEHLASEALEQGKPVIVVRAFHHTGPRQRPPMFLPQWVQQLVENQCAELFVYTREAYFDLSDVRDVVRAYRLLVEKAPPGIYNVGSGQKRQSGELAELLLKLAGQSRQIVETRPGVLQEPIANIDRLVKATGWIPQINIEQTLLDTLRWWQDHAKAASGGKGHS